VDLVKVLAKTTLSYLGWSRLQPKIIYRGNLYPIRGKVFMQLALVEFPEGLGIQVGDEVTVPIRKTLAAGNVARYYVRHGQAGKIGDESGTSYVVEEE
jgi:alanine racemase